ncbi:hypothetical protein MAR_033999 [Mya arenaria]|uniref:HAT C-terminal dimerisation domain-containing protein n=1 Tax=Mya arenaria TaxID=6604 RepID=A0ABY7GC08_MYAAR|nr:hypothetical protein MAR_033999 [Mya arenaria]
MVMLLKCCTVIPMTSVQCERGFSTQNRIKSKGRTSIKCTTLDDLMRISEDVPALRDFDFSRALAKWKAEKVRKLNTSTSTMSGASLLRVAVTTSPATLKTLSLATDVAGIWREGYDGVVVVVMKGC